jgi:tetratricopeptide (TPR) repeat protein
MTSAGILGRAGTACVLLPLLLLGAAAQEKEPECQQVVGAITGILLETKSVEEVEAAQCAVRRASVTLQARKGLAICAEDSVRTGSGVTILFQPSRLTDTITLAPDTETEFGEGSLFLRIGRLFAAVRGLFDVKTRFGILAAKGTKFQVEVSSEDLHITQLEDSVEFTPNPDNAFLEFAPSTTAGVIPESGWIPIPIGYQLPQRQSEYGPAPRKTGGAHQLQPLTELTYSSANAQARVGSVERERCRAIVDADSRTFVQTQPAIPSKSLIPAFASTTERTATFLRARIGAVCEPEKGVWLEQLGEAYSDFAQANHALDALQRAAETTPDRGRQALFLNSLGNALRLAGRSQDAYEVYKRALGVDPSFAFPYNGLGDVYRDLASAEVDRGNLGLAQGDLFRAREYYQKSLDQSLRGKEGGTNRAIPFYNLGEVHLVLAQLRPTEVDQNLNTAKEMFEKAISLTGGRYPFAEVGLARIDAVKADIADKTELKGNAGEKIAGAFAVALLKGQLYRSSLKKLDGVTQKYPDFSVAFEVLGEVLQKEGKRSDAVNTLRRSTQLDPYNAGAYFRLADALMAKGDRGTARLYYQTYVTFESPLFLTGERARRIHNILKRPAPALPAPWHDPTVEEIVTPTAQPADDNASRPAAQIVPGSFQFVFGGPDAQAFRIENTGNAPLKIAAVQLEGAPDFSLTNNRCSGQTVAKGASCAFTVRFVAQREGEMNTKIVVRSNASNGTITANVTGPGGIR